MVETVRNTEREKSKHKNDRVPVHERDVLKVNTILDGMVLRWVNDVPMRLETFRRAGWEFVTDKDMTVGDPTVNADREAGTVVKRYVGGNIHAYLMAIPEEFYREDQRVKQEKIDEHESSMLRDLNARKDGSYGKVELLK